MTGVEVQPADIVEAAVNACKRAAYVPMGPDAPLGQVTRPAEWDLDYMEILEAAQVIADGRVRDVRPS